MLNLKPIIAEDDIKCTLCLRIAECIICFLCLITFIVLVCLCPILTYITVIIITVAAVTTIVCSISLYIMVKKGKKMKNKLRFSIALASMIGYFVCLALFIVQPKLKNSWNVFPAAVMACLAAIIFILDLICLLKIILGQTAKKKTQMNQVAPVNSIGVQQSQERLMSTGVCSTIECSVIVGDQLTCDQQLCHLKWSGDQTSSTPTAKLIYVQPCTSTYVTKICPACKKFNCERCFQNEKYETNMDSVVESQSTMKSTQFPNDNENICPLCIFKPVFDTKYTQTLEEQVYSNNTETKLIQSTTASTCPNIESQMVCPKCRKISEFISNQECANYNYKLTCTTCYQAVSANKLIQIDAKTIKCPLETTENIPESVANKMTQVSSEDFVIPSKNISTQVSSKEFIKEEPVISNKNISTQVTSKEFIKEDPVISSKNISTQVSSKEFIKEEPVISNKNISTQVTSKEFIQEQHSCPCFKNEAKPLKPDKCEIETQVSLNDLVEGSPKYVPLVRFKTNENKATSISKNEETEYIILGQTDTQKLYENKLFEEHKSTNEMSDYESVVEIKDNKMTQVSSNDFEKKLCGAPNCQHPKCGQVFLGTQIVDEMVQTKEPTIIVTEKIPEEQFKQISCQTSLENVTDKFKQISCQTSLSSGNSSPGPISPSTEKERNEDLPTDLPECIDPNCTCVINENEIHVCAYCKSMLNVQPTDENDIVEIPHIHDCKCNLPNCICCKKQQSPKNEKCFCIKTEKGLLMCTICEVTNKERAQETAEDKQMDSQRTKIEKAEQSTQIGNERKCSKERKDSKERKKSKERKEDSQTNEIEKAEQSTQIGNERKSIKEWNDSKERQKSKERNEDSQTNEIEKEEQFNRIGRKSIKEWNDSKERHDSKERQKSRERKESKSRKDSKENEQKKQVIYKTGKNEDKKVDYATSTSASESIPFDTDNKDKKSGHAMSYYLSSKPETSTNVTVFTMQNNIEMLDIANDSEDEENERRRKIEWDELANRYQNRIRKNVKPNIIFNDDILDTAQSEMQNIYNSMIKNLVERQLQKENSLKFLEKLNCSCDSDDNSSKYDAGHSTRNVDYEFKETCKDDDVLLKNKESSSSSSDMIISMSENLSLSTITEEISMTTSDLISTSKESKSDIKLAKSIDHQLVKPEEIKYCHKSGILEKCTRKSAGFFEPFIFSPTHESTKTSLTTSDNESTVDSLHYIKTPGSSVSFNLQEDNFPKEEAFQSLSVPITSRSRYDKPHVVSCVRKHTHSIPCTPKSIQRQSADVSRKSSTSTNRKYNEDNEISSRIANKNRHVVPEMKDNDFEMNTIVPPLLIANITPELSLSDSEDSRTISCSSHFSARTLQTIDNYNLECLSLYKSSNLMRLQEMKKSRKSLGLKSQPITKRPFDEKQITGKNVTFNMKSSVKPTIRERRISAPPRSQRKSSPKSIKIKSATASVRTFRQKTATIIPHKSLDKRKSSTKKSKIKSVPVSPEHVCHCDKKSKNNSCKMHPKIKSVPVSHRSNPSCSKQVTASTKTPTIISIISPEMSPKKMSITPIEKPRTWQDSKSQETTPKSKDT